MIATPKASAPFIKTDDIETLARELFNGALPKLPGDSVKRRNVLAREFAAAHLTIPGVCKADAGKFAALGPAFKAIAASRQARVDAFLTGIVPQPTVGSVRQKLVAVLGERALKANVLRAQHQVACVLVLLDVLEGRDTAMDLNLADSGQKLVARLDATFGKAARETMIPRGPGYFTEGLALLANLADAVADSKPVATVPKPAPAATPATPTTADTLCQQIRAEGNPQRRADLFAQLQTVWKTQN